MPSVEAHCKISKHRTGNEYRDLHDWIDAPKKELGLNHRIERHSDNEIYRKYIRENWGEKGVIEWLFHIAIDSLDTAYKASYSVYKERTYNYYEIGLLGSDDILFSCVSWSNEQLLEEFAEVC